MNTCNTATQVHGVQWCVKIQHCTCTCLTHLENTTGLPAPVLHPTYAQGLEMRISS